MVAAVEAREVADWSVDTLGSVLTLPAMAGPAHVLSVNEKLPLALSQELWEALSPTQQALFRRADTLLESFAPESPKSLQELVLSSGVAPKDVLSALRLLDTMALVSIESSDHGPMFSLRATPEEHLRINGPDNKPRWVFIARPVEPRNVDPSTLN